MNQGTCNVPLQYVIRKMKQNRYNPKIHHRRSIRIKYYDYSREGLYFITICTHNHQRLFGYIDNDEMMLSEYGEIAYHEWLQTGEIRKSVVLQEFVIMPNHMHGIIEINDSPRRGTMPRALVHRDKENQGTKHCAPTERFGKPTSNTIPTIVRGFKSTVTKQINNIRKTSGYPVWQRSYYEHIIRNEKSYNRISEYIRYNPKKWLKDKYYMD
jgi:hypothetical protein